MNCYMVDHITILWLMWRSDAGSYEDAPNRRRGPHNSIRDPRGSTVWPDLQAFPQSGSLRFRGISDNDLGTVSSSETKGGRIRPASARSIYFEGLRADSEMAWCDG